MPSWASCLAIIRMPGALEALPPHLPCMPPGAVPGDRIFKNTPQTRLAPNRGFPRRLRLLKKQKIEKLQHREFFHAPAPRPMKRQRHEMGTFGALPRSAETPQKRPRGPRPSAHSHEKTAWRHGPRSACVHKIRVTVAAPGSQPCIFPSSGAPATFPTPPRSKRSVSSKRARMLRRAALRGSGAGARGLFRAARAKYEAAGLRR